MIQKEGGGGGRGCVYILVMRTCIGKREVEENKCCVSILLWSCSDFEVLLCPAESLQQSDGKVESNRNYNRKLPPLLHSHMR